MFKLLMTPLKNVKKPDLSLQPRSFVVVGRSQPLSVRLLLSSSLRKSTPASIVRTTLKYKLNGRFSRTLMVSDLVVSTQSARKYDYTATYTYLYQMLSKLGTSHALKSGEAVFTRHRSYWLHYSILNNSYRDIESIEAKSLRKVVRTYFQMPLHMTFNFRKLYSRYTYFKKLRTIKKNRFKVLLLKNKL